MSAPPTTLESKPQPRLGIGHLLLWTLTSAVCLTMERWLIELAFGIARNQWLLTWYAIVASMAKGAVLGGLAIWISRRVRGGAPFPVAPGHYLLVFEGGRSIVSACGYAVGYLWINYCVTDLIDGLQGYLSAQMVAASCNALLALVCLRGCRAPLRWKMVLFAELIAEGLSATGSLAQKLTYSPMSFDSALDLTNLAAWWMVIAGMIIAVLIDAWRRERHDWLHFAGVGASFAITASYLLFRLVLWI